mmetsp:Transcript_22103/g.49147  ORF Transcript_22103/g.49147 Transcript_22103/m.49147 type:complete len:230 (+) Transcript_22103:60-749(+)
MPTSCPLAALPLPLPLCLCLSLPLPLLVDVNELQRVTEVRSVVQHRITEHQGRSSSSKCSEADGVVERAQHTRCHHSRRLFLRVAVGSTSTTPLCSVLFVHVYLRDRLVCAFEEELKRGLVVLRPDLVIVPRLDILLEVCLDKRQKDVVKRPPLHWILGVQHIVVDKHREQVHVPLKDMGPHVAPQPLNASVVLGAAGEDRAVGSPSLLQHEVCYQDILSTFVAADAQW